MKRQLSVVYEQTTLEIPGILDALTPYDVILYEGKNGFFQ